MSNRYHPYGGRGATPRRLFRDTSRTYTRPYRRAASATELAKLKRVVSANRLEKKQFYGTGSTANVFATTTQVINLAGAIAQGAGYNQRLGREIRINRIRIGLRWVPSGTASRDEIIQRALLVKTKQQTFNTAPTGAQVLLAESQSWRSQYNPDYVGKTLTVLDDQTKTKTLNYAAAVPEAIMDFDYKFSSPHKMLWSLDTDDIQEGGLYMVFASNQPTNYLTAYWEVIVDYTD